MNRVYLWPGVVLLLAAMTVRTALAGNWSVALVAIVGLLLILASFSSEEGGHGHR